MRGYRTGAFFLVGVTLLASLAWGGDAITEAKRKAAADLMKEGKTADAIAMIGEVIRVDPENYRDHLLLARGFDKLNKAQEAAEQYREVLSLPGSAEDRPSRLEAERRLKVLDIQMNKILAAEDEFLKKLDQLERDAIAAKDERAVERVFKLKGAVWHAQHRTELGTFEVHPNLNWQPSGMMAKQGATYLFRAVGRYTIMDQPNCTADGLAGEQAFGGNIGCLAVAIVGSPQKFAFVGSRGQFTAPTSGELMFLTGVRDEKDRLGSKGSITVMIQAK